MVLKAYIHREVAIEAPPDKVRAQFLDFGNLLRYTDGKLFRSIRPKRAGTDDPIEGVDAKPGDGLTIATSTGLTPRIDAKVVENSPQAFRYQYAVGNNNATHSFEFRPDPSDSTRTIFRQSQTISGSGAWQYWFWTPFRWLMDGKLDGYNDDLKQAVEGKETSE